MNFNIDEVSVSQAKENVYSAVKIENIDAFNMAFYIVISKDAANDANFHIDKWVKTGGALENLENPVKIGWDFPFLSDEQKKDYGFRGYAVAYILPESFSNENTGLDIMAQKKAQYAVITVKESSRSNAAITKAYALAVQQLARRGYKQSAQDDILSSFEYEYEFGGEKYINIYVNIMNLK